MNGLAQLLSAIRRRCPPSLWSQGTQLANASAVSLEREAEDEVVLRVRVEGWAVAPTVVLYLETEEWACDCGGTVAACGHVAAAVLALDLARREGRDLRPTAATRGQLGYRLGTRDGVLVVRRVLVAPDGAEKPLHGSLALGGGEAGLALSPSETDLLVDRLLDALPDGRVPAARVPELFAQLASCGDVRLDGAPVRISEAPVPPRATVDARGDDDGFVVRLARDPRVTGVVARGVVRCGEWLHPVGAAALAGESLEKLPAVREFPRRRVAELVLEVLPRLADAQVPVEVRARKLPERTRALRPRVSLELDQREHTLSVLPVLVYGDPPQARIQDGELVYLAGAVPMRDEAAERALAQRLRDELDLAPGRLVHFDGHEAVRFAARLRSWRESLDTAGARELFGARPVAPRVVATGDGTAELVFEAEADAPGEGDRAPARRAAAEDVLRAHRDGLGLVPLEGGGWAPLPADWLERHGHLVADLLAARGADGRVPPAAVPTLARLCEALEQPPPPGFDRLAPLVAGFAALPAASLPADLTAELRPYQRRGVDWLAFLRDAELGGVLADDMGLGKTLQTLCAIRGRTLVVCPRSVVHNWADEIRRFRPALRVAVYHGARRTLEPTADVTLTTYAVLRLDAEALAAVAWDAVVLDEAQVIKNPDSQAARAAGALRARFRVALSGTPVENRLDELWSLLHFANPGLLGGRGDFRDRYATPIAEGDGRAAARLRERIRPFLLRRAKRDVAPELPPRTDAVLCCELDEPERAVYDAVRVATRKEVVSRLESGGSVMAALEALLRLRQAACHRGLLPGHDAPSSAKVERLMAALEQVAADGHKALVFSQWTSLLDRVEPHLRAAGVPFTRLDGATVDRGGVVAEFQSEAGPPVLLASLRAGGTGLNLTAADHVFLLDPWWNPAAEDQAADRAHRIGQQRPVLVYRLVARDTVEEGILALQARKRALAGAALEGGDAALGITRDDLLALLA